MLLHSVHGEYKFSALDMPPPERCDSTGGRLTGFAMRDYVEKFSKMFLEGKAKFRFRTEVLNVERIRKPSGTHPAKWVIKARNVESGVHEEMEFSRIVLATGVRGRYAVSRSMKPTVRISVLTR